MDLQLLDDGTMLVADTKTKRPWRCGSLEHRCRPIEDLSGIAGRLFKLHLDPASLPLFVAAAHTNRVWQVRSPCGRDEAKPAQGDLAGPNELWLSPAERSGSLIQTTAASSRSTPHTNTSPRPGAGSSAEPG